MKYNPKTVEKICKLVASGEYTVEDICTQVGISESTYYEWKATKSEFSEAYKKAEEGRLAAFKRMARSGLAKRLDIYEFEEVTTEFENDKNGKPKVKGRKVTKKVIMPSDTLIIFTLKNTDSENFKDKQLHDHTTNGKDIQAVTVFQLPDNGR